MSKVKNEPKIKNKLIVAIREQLEHRALWLYLLCDEAKKRGLDPNDFAAAAIKRCGLAQGKNLVKKGKTKSLKGLRKRPNKRNCRQQTRSGKFDLVGKLRYNTVCSKNNNVLIIRKVIL